MSCTCGATATNQPGHSIWCDDAPIHAPYWDEFKDFIYKNSDKLGLFVTNDRNKLYGVMSFINNAIITKHEYAHTSLITGKYSRIYIEQDEGWQDVFDAAKEEQDESCDVRLVPVSKI